MSELKMTDSQKKRLKSLETVMRFSPQNTGLEPVSGFAEDDDKCIQRIADFFDKCIAEELDPTWELMATYLGVTVWTLQNWEQKKLKCVTDLRSETISRARSMFASYDAQLASTGAMHPTTYIFRSKNFYGMKDQTETVTVKRDDEAIKSIEEIKAEMKLLQSDN